MSAANGSRRPLVAKGENDHVRHVGRQALRGSARDSPFARPGHRRTPRPSSRSQVSGRKTSGTLSPRRAGWATRRRRPSPTRVRRRRVASRRQPEPAMAICGLRRGSSMRWPPPRYPRAAAAGFRVSGFAMDLPLWHIRLAPFRTATLWLPVIWAVYPGRRQCSLRSL